MKTNYLLFAVLALFSFSVPAMAQYEGDTPSEELIESTEGMAEEATETFEENVECAHDAMNGEEPSEDCVSKEEESTEDMGYEESYDEPVATENME